MKNFKLILVFFLISLLCACGSLKGRVSNPSPKSLSADAFNSSNKGIVIFSTGAPSENCFGSYTVLRIRNTGTKELVEVPILVDYRFLQSDFNTHHGTVNALELMPGNYIFELTKIGDYFPPEALFPFYVNAKEIAYLGELFQILSCNPIKGFLINDRFERDMGIAVSQNPKINLYKPVKRIINVNDKL